MCLILMEDILCQLTFSPGIWLPNILFGYVFIFSIISLLWELYLLNRQFKLLQNVTQVPKELIGFMDNETLTMARNHNINKIRVAFVDNTYKQIQTIVVLYFGAIPFLWSLSGSIISKIGFFWTGMNCNSIELVQTILFMIIADWTNHLANLLLNTLKNFFLSQKYQLNTETIIFWPKKELIVDIFLVPILCSPIIGLIFWDAMFIIPNICQIFSQYILPICILTIGASILLIKVFSCTISWMACRSHTSITPLLNKEVRKNFEQLAKDIGFPSTNIPIYVIKRKVQKASLPHLEPHIVGIDKIENVLIFDTLFEDYYKKQHNRSVSSAEYKPIGCNNEEIIGLLAHELGHWYLNHHIILLLISDIKILLYFWLYGKLYQNPILYQAFGFSAIDDVKPIIIGTFLIFRFVFWPLDQLVLFVFKFIRRKSEYSADTFVKSIKKETNLKKALIRQYKDSLAFPDVDWLYSFCKDSHPTLLQRLQNLGVESK